MTSKTITIEPMGGLANRLRAIDSAIHLAEASSRKLIVKWNIIAECNIHFLELFHTVDNIDTVKGSPSDIGTKVKWKISAITKSSSFIGQQEIEQLGFNQKSIISRIEKQNHVHINTYSRFFDYSSPFQFFKPLPHLQNQIEKLINPNMIAVHIRRTDNRISIENSSLDGFISLMQKELSIQPNTTFFLATDSPEDEHKIKSLFPDKIFSYKKRSLDRNNPLAIEDATIDLFTLATCTKIIGSYWSSFSELAGEINNIELIIAKS